MNPVAAAQIEEEGPVVAARKFALVVPAAKKGLDWLVMKLRANGFRVAIADTFREVPAAINKTPWLSLLVIDSHALQAADRTLLGDITSKHPELPVLWIDPRARKPRGDSDAIMAAKPEQQDILAKVQGLLSQRFYPNFVIEGMSRCASEAFRDGFRIDAELLAVSLKLTRTVLGKMIPLINFCGPGVSGQLVLNASIPQLRAVYKKILPKKRPTAPELGDLGGEILNQVLGRLKSHFSRHGIGFELGLPLVVTGDNLVVRVPRAAPAVVFDFGVENRHMYLEFSLTSIDLQSATAAQETGDMGAGELSFL